MLENTFLAKSVVDWISKERFLVVLLVEYSVDDNRQRAVEYVVELVQIGLIKSLTREVVSKSVPRIAQRSIKLVTRLCQSALPKLWQDHNDILEEVEEDTCRVSSVTLSSVIEQQPFNVLELSDAVVAGSRRLVAFLAFDSNSNMSCVDHIDIICTVTDGHCDYVWLLEGEKPCFYMRRTRQAYPISNKRNDLLLLKRRNSGGDEGLTSARHFHKLCLCKPKFCGIQLTFGWSLLS